MRQNIAIDDLAHLGILNVFGKKEKTITQLKDCYQFNPYDLNKALCQDMFDKHITEATPDQVRKVLSSERYKYVIKSKEQELLDNLQEKDWVQCGYIVLFDDYGNAGLLLARKDLEKLYAILDQDEIDQIRRYHPETGEYMRGLEGLIRGQDKAAYTLDHLSNEEKDEALQYERGIKKTFERIIKTIGGKYDEYLEINNQQHLWDWQNHKQTVIAETQEETGWEKILYLTPFARMIEEKGKIVKVDVAHWGLAGGARGNKKFSFTEIPQDLVEIYLPIDIAIAIFHKTIFRKLEEETIITPLKRKKLSSCIRSYLFFKYFKQHQERILKTSRVPKKLIHNRKIAT